MFKKKTKSTGIFDDLPVFQAHPSIQHEEQKKTGRRAMLIPDTAPTADLSADELFTNTGKQKEVWLQIIFESTHREEKQKAVASFLQESYRVQKWWANSIALMYLNWREAPKTVVGTGTVLRLSKLIEAPSFRVFSILNSEKVFAGKLKRFLKQVDSERLVLSFNDQTRASIIFRAHEGDCEVLIEHEFITNQEDVNTWNVFWQELLLQVASQVTR